MSRDFSISAQRIAFVGDTHIRSTNPRSRKDDFYTAITEKIDEIASSHDTLVFLGDVFDKPSLDFEYLTLLYEQFRGYQNIGKKLYTIIGNHDVYNYNENTLTKTVLGLFDSLGVLSVFDTLTINESVFVCRLPLFATMPQRLKLPKSKLTQRILLAHSYFQSDLDENTLTFDHLKSIYYDVAIFGHDHEPYEPLTAGDTTVYRPGSLCRKDAHKSQMRRIPQYLSAGWNGERLEFETVPVRCAKPAEEVFFTEALHKPIKDKQEPARMADLKLFSARPLKSLPEVMRDNGADPESISYIRGLHDRIGAQF